MPNCSPETQSLPPITLVLKGMHITSFKNTKMIARGRLITAPKKQEQMEQIIQAFVSQLSSWCQTHGIGMETGCSALLRIASFLPLDDSLAWIGEHNVKWRKVSKGNEGAVITIEPI